MWRKALLAVLVLGLGLAAGPGAAGERHADPGLELLLPATLGGDALRVESQAGTDLVTQSAPFDAFLAALGRTRADFTLASAYSLGALPAAVGAWRVQGADPAKLLPAFQTAVEQSSATPLTIAEEDLGGRSVVRIGDPGQLARGPLYAYAQGEVVLFVQTTQRSLAEEAMSKLPP